MPVVYEREQVGTRRVDFFVEGFGAGRVEGGFGDG